MKGLNSIEFEEYTHKHAEAKSILKNSADYDFVDPDLDEKTDLIVIEDGEEIPVTVQIRGSWVGDDFNYKYITIPEKTKKAPSSCVAPKPSIQRHFMSGYGSSLNFMTQAAAWRKNEPWMYGSFFTKRTHSKNSFMTRDLKPRQSTVITTVLLFTRSRVRT